MTTFIVLCAVMTAAALLVLARPLLRKDSVAAQTRSSAVLSFIIAVIAIPTLAGVLYVRQSNWNWHQAEAVAVQTGHALQVVQRLEARLQSTPNDLQGWLLLGRSYRELDLPAKALTAFQRAYELSGGASTEATLGLAESLVLTDPESLRGRAGELFEVVLAREPQNPAALWYGAIAALSVGKLTVGRERIAALLAQDPPEQIRAVLERQLRDLDEQLAQAPLESKASPAAAELKVTVQLAPAFVGQVDPAASVFVLARDAQAGGPPLAVVRRRAGELPLTVTLSDRDAMMAGRGISSVRRIQVVARISKSGVPQAQRGDWYGEALVESGAPANVAITIDRTVDQ